MNNDLIVNVHAPTSNNDAVNEAFFDTTNRKKVMATNC